jgi:hypothetical protein
MSLFSLPPLPPDIFAMMRVFRLMPLTLRHYAIIFAFRYFFHCHAIIISFYYFADISPLLLFSLPLFSLFSFRCHYADDIIFATPLFRRAISIRFRFHAIFRYAAFAFSLFHIAFIFFVTLLLLFFAYFIRLLFAIISYYIHYFDTLARCTLFSLS